MHFVPCVASTSAVSAFSALVDTRVGTGERGGEFQCKIQYARAFVHIVSWWELAGPDCPTWSEAPRGGACS